MGDAMTSLAGAVSREPGNSLGANTGRGGDGEGPGDFGNSPRAGWPGVTTPVLITQVKPHYTAEAMRAKVQGLVMVECIVMPDGSVGDARIVRSLDPVFGLDQEAITAAKKWRFKPGLLNGTAVPVIVTIELSFMLR
jgi:protein TonB